jgi:hypothetical protein
MIDEEEITKRYLALKKKRPGMNLLPLKKIIELEKSRIQLLDLVDDQALGIDKAFELTGKPGLSIDSFIEFCMERFGTLNFKNMIIENEQPVITLAFSFCLVTIKNGQAGLLCTVNPYWDI